MIVLAALGAIACRNTTDPLAQQKREANYKAALQTYSEALKPGIARKDVEDYFRTRGIPFVQLGGSVKEPAFMDLVKIGEGDHPWYCSEHWVHIAFHFGAGEPNNNHRPHDSDVLKTITIYHEFGGCL